MDKNLYNSNKQVTDDKFSYSFIGAIPRLPAKRQHDSYLSGNVNGVFRAFSHPCSKFHGSGSMHENLGTFHQSYINTCKTFNLTEDEAFSNLYVLLPINSDAGRFYDKNVVNRAKNLNEAFNMLYARFMSSERRNRLLQKWNNLKFSDFISKPGLSRHIALRELCSLASSIQLQLGPSYQDDQHLQYSLINACKNEPWAHRLVTMPTTRLLDIEESLARAITGKE